MRAERLLKPIFHQRPIPSRLRDAVPIPALVLIITVFAFPVLSRAETRQATVVLRSLRVEDLTGQSMTSAQSADSLFRLLLARPVFERPVSKWPRERDYHRIENPLLACSGVSGDTVSIRLALELEVCAYGPFFDTESEFAAFWMLGLLGTVISQRDRIAGNVQWRAHVEWSGQREPLQLIGRGISIGNPHELGLREAMVLANRRALYDLATELSLALNEELNLGVKQHIISMRFEEFEKIVDTP